METTIEQVKKGLNTVCLNNTLETVTLIEGLYINGEFTTESVSSIVTRLFEQGFNEISLK